MKRISFPWENLSIRLKILCGFAIICLIFIFHAVLHFQTMLQISQSFTALEKLTQNTIQTLDIDKDVLDLQKSALDYGQNGNEKVFNKMELKFHTISKNIQDISKKQLDQENLNLIKSMDDIAQKYGENISSLNKSYQYRENITKIQLPEIIKKGTLLFQEMSENSSQDKPEIQKKKQKALQYWLEIHIHAKAFLEEKKFQDKQEVYKKIKFLKELSTHQEIQKQNLTQNNTSFISLHAMLDNFIDIFDQAVQANRVYFSLVNVVMSGEALEFANIAKKLRIKTLKRLEATGRKRQDEFDYLKFLFIFTLILTLPIFILIIFINTNISQSLRKISDTFSKLLNGDFTENIPGIERKDEIGQLANAANAFKEMSRKLQLSKITAEKSTKTKSEFLANMSHEIRTPMNGILGMISLMQETQISQKQRHMLDTMSSCGDSLLTILNDILDFSKIESGKIDFEERPFSIKESIDNILFLFENVAHKKQIQFTCDIIHQDIPPYVLGDITRVKQVLTNLVSNALKFTEKGFVKLEVDLLNQKKINSFNIRFSIKDSGIGMTQEEQKKLFQAFSQADTSITRKFGGTGLGLAISSKIIKMMGGKINVVSEKGKGSHFYFDLHFEKSSPPQTTQSLAKKSTKTTTQLNILLAEDNIINIEIACLMLKQLGHSVDVAHNGLEAVEMEKKFQYDVILMDMQMPIMDGVTSAAAIKKSSNIPIIAVTANVLPEDKNKCIKAGMEIFLTKPMSRDSLEKALGQIKKQP
ncbi:MAG: ATP-binding protein [Oligoflexales bacterium]